MKEKQDNVRLTELPAFQQDARLELQQYKGAHVCICHHERASVSCIEHTLIWSPPLPSIWKTLLQDQNLSLQAV